MVYIFFAEGFEEIEAITPADVLRRAGLSVTLVGVGGCAVTGSHGIKIECDTEISEIAGEDGEAFILPGGMPGTKNLLKNEKLKGIIKDAADKTRLIGAICAAPMILGEMGLLSGREATCFPGYEGHLKGATLVKERVAVSDNIITAKGAGAAGEFAFALVTALKGAEAAKALRLQMQYE